jgi:hypothetical protein
VIVKTHYEKTVEYLETVSENYLSVIVGELSEKYGREVMYDQVYKYVNKGRECDELGLSTVNILYHLLKMRMNGEKVYYVMSGLVMKLVQTECNVGVEYLKSPYSEIYVAIDRGMFHIVDVDDKVYSVDGFYVNFEEKGGVKCLRVMAAANLKETEEIPYNDLTFYFRFELVSGKIREEIKKRVRSGEYDRVESGKRNMQYIEDFMNFICNVLLYVTSKGADLEEEEPVCLGDRVKNLKSSAKIRKMLKRSEKYTSKVIVVVGRLVGSSREVDELKLEGSVGKWKLKNKFMVSGHWRVQWYGDVENRYSKLIWVVAYEKGPEFASEINKRYVVK